MITGEVEAVDRKQKIRDRYKGVDISELEVIPAKIIEDLETSSVIRRVAAYIRVSTDNDEQTSSYELQKNYYTDYIQAQPGWVFVGIYADEGISGTSLEHRKGMQQLIEDCKAGKIDLVLTKSIARFARNIVDCLSVIELLKNLNPPVGVKFEADNIYTLDSNGRMILTILASVAEEESHSKSIIMNWSIDRRFSRGLFLTPALLGYDKDEEGNLVINPEEAQTVKVIYYLYLNGYSLTEIATLLMEYAVCLEGSLKLKEISYIHSEAYAAGELKHGTISLIEQGTLVIGVLTQSELYEKTISNMLECKSRGAYLMGLTTYGKYEIEDQVNFTVYVPKVDEHFVGSLAVIPLQLLGYYVSVAKGLDVDKPRNLAKSVTVE